MNNDNVKENDEYNDLPYISMTLLYSKFLTKEEKEVMGKGLFGLDSMSYMMTMINGCYFKKREIKNGRNSFEVEVEMVSVRMRSVGST